MDNCKNCRKELGNWRWHLTEKSTGNKFCSKPCAEVYKRAVLTGVDKNG